MRTNMKVAVSAVGKTLDSAVDPRFGRAAGFVLVDTETGEHEAIDNAQNLHAMQGAGIQAAQTVSSHKADYVITGHCGPKAFRTLEAAGVKVVIGAEGTVAEAVEKLKSGELMPTQGADVEGHWA
jgi:predicted Fe-Mo cluster-binding NifX family protein